MSAQRPSTIDLEPVAGPSYPAYRPTRQLREGAYDSPASPDYTREDGELDDDEEIYKVGPDRAATMVNSIDELVCAICLNVIWVATRVRNTLLLYINSLLTTLTLNFRLDFAGIIFAMTAYTTGNTAQTTPQAAVEMSLAICAGSVVPHAGMRSVFLIPIRHWITSSIVLISNANTIKMDVML